MTYGEVVSVLEEQTRQLWDRRYWDLAMKSDRPVDSYLETLSNLRSLEESPKVDELPDEQQDWLRKS